MEEIIYNYLCDNIDGLTTYADVPAVFNTKAPDDKDENWNEETQFPRIIFDLNMQADPERKISGQLMVDVMCEDTADSISVEEIEKSVKDYVDGCFFSAPDLTISAQWNSSNPFEQKDNDVIGTTVVFDILAYPSQVTESPDPVASTNLWLKTIFQDAYVIGRDTLPQTWKPTDETPAIYCSLFHLGESTRLKSTSGVDWIGAELHINIMAPSESTRATISKQIIQLLNHATRIILGDGSPMLIDKLNANLAADPLRTGQLTVNTTYGVLTTETKTRLRHTYIQGMDAESEV